MRRHSPFALIVFLSFLMGAVFSSKAQPTWTFNPFGKDKKPTEYEDKKLPSEKTADKKFTIFRHFLHNTTTHYNYYFNANNKLEMVLDRARASQKDDFTKLLSFYPYSLENTASQKVELDSVIYKCTAGILLHDLRSDWVDNMYLLIGKSYYYRKVFDTAALTFQFVNYNLFPRKKNEDDSRVVGGNISENGVRKLSIANKESRNLLKRTFSLPPSRNDALIWLARTYTETDQFGEAAGLINILQEDPNLPVRLKDELNQVTAYWFYRQEAYDSSASYLEKGLTSAENHTDKSRWYFLLGQMFEISGKYDKAAEYFELAAQSTVDPLLDIYAHLNNAKMMKSKNDTIQLNKSITSLLKMAGKDKYEAYRDIIFHSAAMLSLQKPDTGYALTMLEKSLRFNEKNTEYKNKAHLLWGRISYIQRDYKTAANHYDSLDIKEPSVKNDSAEIADRRSSLRKVADQMMVIDNEDSLQAVAALPDIERDVFLKKLVKKLKKEKGQKDQKDQKEEEWVSGPTLKSFDNGRNNAPADLFSTSSKGEWYFYNASQKSKGYTEFKSKWGKRDNVDNWRRRSAMALSNFANGPGGMDPLAPSQDSADAASGGKPVDNSYDALLSNLPLTPEKMEESNKKIKAAYLELGRLFRNELQDYLQAVYFYEILLKRFPDEQGGGEVYLGLHHAYGKLGNKDKAAYYKSLLDTGYKESNFAKMLNDPLSLQPEKNNPSTSRLYQNIYDLFIEGKFDSAFALKIAADQKNGKQYWSAPLLYIEAMYYVKCARDSDAITILQELISSYPASPLKAKSETMIDVLRRRSQIENYLNNLQVNRVQEEKKLMIPVEAPVAVRNNPPQPVQSVQARQLTPVKNITISPDSALKMAPALSSGAFEWQAVHQHFVVMVLDKVDGVYINEAKNAYNRYNLSNGMSRVKISRDTLNAEKTLLVFSAFESAQEAFVYFEKVKKAAPTQVSWLPAGKYQFLIASDKNLKLLQSNKDMEGYRKLLNTQYPGKF